MNIPEGIPHQFTESEFQLGNHEITYDVIQENRKKPITYRKHSGFCEYIEWKRILPGTHHYDQTIKYSY